MKNQPTTFKSRVLPRFLRATCIAGLLPSLVLLLSIQSSHAGSATWLATPATGDWTTAANWTAGGPPNGSADTATFASSNLTGVSLSAFWEVNGIVFNAGASAFTITVSPPPSCVLTISGVGITNNSGITQNFVTNTDNAGSIGGIGFTNSATAGSMTAFTSNGSAIGGFGSFIQFSATSTAGNGTFTANGGAVNGASGGQIVFSQTSTAGNATLVANGGLGGGAGSLIEFQTSSTGGTARVEIFGNGTGDSANGMLGISGHDGPGLTIGSLEGSGLVLLGNNNLTVGANNLSTAFSGIISDGGLSGSLTKIGKGKQTFSNGNTYTGGTTVNKGTLLVTNRSGSATGTGAVAVNAGTLDGTGKISGAVTIGTTTSAAILAPGSGTRPGKLTLSRTLTFNARANYKVDLNSTLVTADQVAARGVTINSGATVTIGDLGSGTLTAGTVFTIINNTAATPIAGTFSNLADGSTLIVGSNTYLVSYEGGTGNDLTLTVQ